MRTLKCLRTLETMSRISAFPWALLAAFSVSIAGSAAAEPRPYRGPHPLDLDGHWHDENSVHVHDTLVVGLEPFASVDGVLVFLADPVTYGYAGQTWSFVDAHPLPAGYGIRYCAISGLHRHAFAPEGEGSYRRGSDGSFAFVGTMHGGAQSYVPGRLLPPASAPVSIATSNRSAAQGIPVCPVVARIVNGATVYEPNTTPGYACVAIVHAPYAYAYPRVLPVPVTAPPAPVPPVAVESPRERASVGARAGVAQRRSTR